MEERKWGEDWLTDPKHDANTCATCARTQPTCQEMVDELQADAVAGKIKTASDMVERTSAIANYISDAHVKGMN